MNVVVHMRSLKSWRNKRARIPSYICTASRAWSQCPFGSPQIATDPPSIPQAGFATESKHTHLVGSTFSCWRIPSGHDGRFVHPCDIQRMNRGTVWCGAKHVVVAQLLSVLRLLQTDATKRSRDNLKTFSLRALPIM